MHPGQGSEPRARGSRWRIRLGVTTVAAVGLAIAAVAISPGSGGASPTAAWSLAATSTPGAAPLPATNSSGKAPATDPMVASNGVGCTSTSFCVSVGSYLDAGGANQQDGFIDTLSGTTWSATVAPEPASTGATPAFGPGTDADSHQFGDLEAVTCPTQGTCFAVGQYDDTNGASYGLIDTVSNGTWSAAAAPQPSTNGFGTAPGTDASAKQAANLDAITCSSTTSCVAVGHYEDADGNTFGLIETYASGTWSALAAAEPATDPVSAGAANSTGGAGSANLDAVSCASTASCVAVGQYKDADGNEIALAEQLSNGAWVPTAAAEPGTNPLGTAAGYASTGGGRANFNAVDCPAAGTCLAVGYYNDTNHDRYGLIDSLANGSWSPSAASEPAANAAGIGPGTDGDGNGFGTLAAVSCPTAGFCVAVGGYNDAKGIEYGLIAQGAGTTFSASAAFEPPNAGSETDAFAGADLDAVACPTIEACAAAGYYIDSTTPSGFRYALADTLTGTTWAASAAPEPANAGTDTDSLQRALGSEVGCTDDGMCLLAGAYRDTSGHTDGLLDTYLPQAPVVVRISPRTGELARTESISGTGFYPGSAVYFGRVKATAVTYESPRLLRAVTPPFHLQVPIEVTNDGGTSSATAANEFTYGSPVHYSIVGDTFGLSGVVFTWHCDKFAACHVRAWLQVVVRNRVTGHVSRGTLALRRLSLAAGKSRRIQLLLTAYGKAIVRAFHSFSFERVHMLAVTPGNVHDVTSVLVRQG
jgi:hypothetical protein